MHRVVVEADTCKGTATTTGHVHRGDMSTEEGEGGIKECNEERKGVCS